ncbi:16S rRNA (uracil(1498)-N(3))-methyltransferase [Helcococcus sueciensis]|uniref:16S rRNA (uracil(1498)-N(3))-methyltransferase n=1 Tax=Helcococcus sueciensis TaxID=241555 RepID=UPI00041AC5FA|nr:16S rRNA (uracil(1498)-N(3))-methyltransferase [Helcococcus sueciensis]
MFRFFEDETSLQEDKILLNKSNLKHIKVLRIAEDEEIEIVINGIVYLSKLIDFNGEKIANIISKRIDENESDIRINLYQGLPKSDKFEWIIQKSIELGVNEIVPFESERTIVKWDNKKEKKKLERYSEIAESAAKQSKRTYIPKVSRLLSFNEMLEELKNSYTILAYENRGNSLRDILQKDKPKEINIIIGPEGGFSEEEVKKFERIGANIVNLGKRILRTETAAIALISMIQYELGDINI